jgi:hypothetical protein
MKKTMEELVGEGGGEKKTCSTQRGKERPVREWM